MKVIKDYVAKSGKRVMHVEVLDGETLMAFSRNQTYKLGDPINDIIFGSAIIDSWPAYWEQIGQEWIV